MSYYSNKNIVITGSSKGLGYHAALDFSKRGANLALLSRDEDALIALTNKIGDKRHIYYANDLLDSENTEEVAINILNHFNHKVDVILHAAGGGYGMHNTLISSDNMYSLFMANLGGAININNIIVPHMIEVGSGNIIHIGSIASHEVTGSVGYNTIKSAVSAYVRTIGKELSKSGIIVTGILPGGFVAKDNAMVRLCDNKPDIYNNFIQERLPRGYMGDVDELLPLIRLLSSNEASMMGGCMVPIDAGEGNAYIA